MRGAVSVPLPSPVNHMMESAVALTSTVAALKANLAELKGITGELEAVRVEFRQNTSTSTQSHQGLG